MPACWNLECSVCHKTFAHVQCSMYSIPPCECGGERFLITSSGHVGTTIFPFTLPHVDGKPMEIRSYQHLRQVENRYGVVFSAFSKDNINDLDAIKSLPKYRGDEPDFGPR